MKYKIFTVRDRALNAYGQPFFASSVGGAVRGFSDEVNRSADNNQLHKHAEDFDLFTLGEFDDSTGTFETTPPAQVAVGKDLLIKA